jgi:hypothetical protein
VSWYELRPIDRLHAIDGLLVNVAWQHLTVTAERAAAEAAISAGDPGLREEARQRCLAWRELTRRLADERTRAREELVDDGTGRT